MRIKLDEPLNSSEKYSYAMCYFLEKISNQLDFIIKNLSNQEKNISSKVVQVKEKNDKISKEEISKEEISKEEIKKEVIKKKATRSKKRGEVVDKS